MLFSTEYTISVSTARSWLLSHSAAGMASSSWYGAAPRKVWSSWHVEPWKAVSDGMGILSSEGILGGTTAHDWWGACLQLEMNPGPQGSIPSPSR